MGSHQTDKSKRYMLKYRLLAFLLSLILCFQGSGIEALAAAEDSAVSDSISENNTETALGEDSASDNETVSENNPETAPREDNASGDETVSENNAETVPREDDASGDETVSENNAETVPGEDSVSENDGTSVSENDGASVSENDASSVSENDAESVSENHLSSVSENDLSAEQQALIKEAEEAFAKLLEEKDIMALLYHADSYSARSRADANSLSAAELEIGTTLYLQGVKITKDDVWYQVRYWLGGEEGTGYVESYYLAYSDEDWIAWEKNYLAKILTSYASQYERSAYGMFTAQSGVYAADHSDIEAFPYSYQNALSKLKAAHPNWTFVPMNTGLDFGTAVRSEKGEKSLIQATAANKENGWVGAPCPSESGWNYATESAIAYHMNPCNFLTEDYIFQFEQLTFNASYHSTAAVQSFLDATFMRGVLPDDSAQRTYAQAFYEIGKNRKLSPIHLASRVYQEQGQGNSGLISGTYPGYEGYYNFFNVNVSGASTAEKIVKGLTYAKEKGWNTRYKSLDGGAATIGLNYILKGQDTVYLEKFNVNKDSPHGLYNHQYMQNIQAPKSESYSTKRMYAGAGTLNSAFVFKIPVFSNMPSNGLALSQSALTVNKGESAQLIASVDGVQLNDNAGVIWKSADTTVATVEQGVVTGVSAGETTVTASYEDETVSCQVMVKSPLMGVSLDQTELMLRRPDTVVEDTSGLTPDEIAANRSDAVLRVIFDPEDTTDDRTIVWSSSNQKIATVQANEDGSSCTVTALMSGEVTVTAKASKAGGKSASCKVKVTAPVYKLEVTNLGAAETQEGKKGTLYAGQSVNLTAEYWPKDTTTDTKVEWSSSNPDAAQVYGGKVTAKSAGTAVITARLAGCQDTYEITVEECKAIFMNREGSQTVRTVSALYGTKIPEDEFPKMEDTDGAVFAGWYTKPDGQGRRFDGTTAVYEKQIFVYPHYEEQGKGFYVIPVGDQTYTGSAVKPVIQVYDSVAYTNGDKERITLVLNKDYTVSYKNNRNVNTEGKAVPTITVKGKGNYTGTACVYFNIVPKALTDHDIAVSDITAAYNGKTIKKAPAVYRGKKKLSSKSDYTVTYPQKGAGAYRTEGTYPIVITGKGGYTGTLTVYETLTKDVLMSKVSIQKIPAQVYENGRVNQEKGEGIEPASLTVTYKKKPLTQSTDGGATGDYTVSYSNNMSVGTATATITAVEGSGFVGSKSVTYKITGQSIAKAKADYNTQATYDPGLNPEDAADYYQNQVTLTLNGKELVRSKDGVSGDYKVSCQNSAKAGTATVVFEGINEYTGKLKKKYKLTPYQLMSEERPNDKITMAYCTQEKPAEAKNIASLSEITAAYVKGGTKPSILLYYDGKPLTPNKDYTVRYANNNAVTTDDIEEKKLPKITVKGKGNFAGTITGSFKITDGAMTEEGGKVTLTAKDMVYKNKKKAWKAAVTIKDVSGKALQAGKDYEKALHYTYEQETVIVGENEEKIVRRAGDTVEETDIPEAGTAIRVTAKGIGFYAGTGSASVSAVYRVTKADMAKAKVSGVPSKEYLNGKAVELSQEDIGKIKVTMQGSAEPLVYGEDYVIDASSYANNIKKGNATVILRGKGNYGGMKKIKFKITSKKLAWWKE